MYIKPDYGSIGDLFRSKPMFFVPKYQRAYAWDSESVSDFIKDLSKCVEKRKLGNPAQHFFGGILSIRHDVPGVINQYEFEIIDGQQRIATLTLLAACLIETYKTLETEAKTIGASAEESILQQRIKDLNERFIEFSQEIHNVIQLTDVLRLSKADNSYYRLLIRKMPCSPDRDSHRKILHAYSSLESYILTVINGITNLSDRVEVLKNVESALVGDFSVIHMVVNNKQDAYTLFQVINDRGTSLTDGDLLRASTLEILEGYGVEQNAVEELWDKILVDSPRDTNDYLNWIYESYVGNRSPQNSLFDMFRDKFFEEYKLPSLTKPDAEKVLATLKNIYQDILNCRKLKQGEWLYEDKQPVTGWDRARLDLLIVELDHTLSIPLFLAASKLDHEKFSEIVQSVEKAFFRYKLICNQHATPLKNIYSEEALNIRNNPITYNVANLRTKLQNLITSRANDNVFKSGLSALQYHESGGNKPLKYFLMTTEYYYQWYLNRATVVPECLDKSRLYDFSGTSIEHVYPKKAKPPVYDATLEPMKHTIGNLTIMDPKQNSTGGNDAFIIKKPLYLASSVELTKKIGANTNWTPTEISTHHDLLLDIAIKIFIP